MPDWLPAHFWQAALVVFAGGFIRGFTGFGANMVMTPLYSLFIDPAHAVAAAWLQDTIAGAPLVPGAVKQTRWRSILWIAVASLVTFPLGLYLLLIAEKEVMRRVIAGTLIVGALLILSGWRFRGEHTAPRDIACGAASGLIGGATSMGGIPFVLYYFAQNTAAAVTRASAYSLTAIIGVFGIAAFVVTGVMDGPLFTLVVSVIPANFVGVWLGVQTFRRVPDAGYRRFGLVFLLAIGVSVLIWG
jgi:uncharacterized membrane protein YfcA